MATNEHAAGADDQRKVDCWKAAVGCLKLDVNGWMSAVG